jgi:predicted alpha/beta-fold hydrolase
MKTSLVKTVTEDNLELHGIFYKSASLTNKAMLLIHGVRGNFYENAFVDEMGQSFTKDGYAFLSVNNRGHGMHGSAFELFMESIFDIKAWINYLVDQDYNDITLIGHSLGASKAVYYLAETSDKHVNKVVLLAPTDVYYEIIENADHSFRGKEKELVDSILSWLK